MDTYRIKCELDDRQCIEHVYLNIIHLDTNLNNEYLQNKV